VRRITKKEAMHLQATHYQKISWCDVKHEAGESMFCFYDRHGFLVAIVVGHKFPVKLFGRPEELTRLVEWSVRKSDFLHTLTIYNTIVFNSEPED
jgi:hypothetical protein